MNDFIVYESVLVYPKFPGRLSIRVLITAQIIPFAWRLNWWVF